MAKYTRVAGYLPVPSYPCRVVTGNLFGHMCGVGYVDLPGWRGELHQARNPYMGLVRAIRYVAEDQGLLGAFSMPCNRRKHRARSVKQGRAPSLVPAPMV